MTDPGRAGIQDRPAIPVLQDWAVRSLYENPYMAPEINPPVLVGKSYGDPRREDGHIVKTTPIASAFGRLVTTSGGTTYRLGRIEREYRKWLEKSGLGYDPREPIKTRTVRP